MLMSRMSGAARAKAPLNKFNVKKAERTRQRQDTTSMRIVPSEQ
jgi:hypothetical protein